MTDPREVFGGFVILAVIFGAIGLGAAALPIPPKPEEIARCVEHCESAHEKFARLDNHSWGWSTGPLTCSCVRTLDIIDAASQPKETPHE